MSASLICYLRDGDFAGAYSNAGEVERTGLFPWNELVRALSAAHLKTDDAVTTEREARRNVCFFDVRRFNPCEPNVLRSADLILEARALTEGERKGAALACAAAPVAKSAKPSGSWPGATAREPGLLRGRHDCLCLTLIDRVGLGCG